MSVRTFGVTGQTNFAVIGGGYKAQVLGDSPSVYYRLDEASGTTIHDATANARDGAVVGSDFTLAQPGAIPSEPSAKSLRITGVGTYINTTSASWMNDTAAQSIGLWLKPGQNYSNAGIVSRFEGSGAQTMLMWYNTANLLEHRWIIGGSTVSVTMNLPLLNVWTHIFATYDGSAVNLYCNGALAASQAASGSIATGTVDLRLGAYLSSGSPFGIGNDYLDEFAMYPYAVPAARIAAQYASALVA